MLVCGVIVTYGDRFHLLSQVINALWKEKIDEVILIDNGSSINTQAALKKYFPDLIIHRFEENKGSAIAFKTGIEKALRSGYDFLWLLDDDTCPEPGSLDHLRKFWNKFPVPEKGKNMALCSYRKDRSNFVDAISNNDPDEILPLKNNFAGFHVKKLFTKIRERLASKKPRPAEQVQDHEKISAAPYGGFFFHKDLVEKIGLPDESYFLYVDDFDFTYRVTKNGGEIQMITGSVIHDLESSFYLPEKKRILYHSAFDSAKDSSVYYALRNTVYFSKKYLVSDKLTYFFNKIIFIIIITIMGILRGKMHKLKVIQAALNDGEKGRLGFNQDYKI